MKKGFTLIELLAVIVILAIIAVIAVPIVLNIINDSKESAVLRSADFYLKGIETAIASSELKGISVSDGTYQVMQDGNICIGMLNDTCTGDILKVEFDGEVPTSGTMVVEKDTIKDIALKYSNDKTITKNDDEDLIIITPKSFGEDSWEVILANVKAGNLSKYNVGDTKEIELTEFTNEEKDESGNNIGTYTVRIANKTNTGDVCIKEYFENEDGTKEKYSKTACGFVIEFEDIIATHNMNPKGEYKGTQYDSGWNVDGYPASSMYTYLQNDIYNALPEELKSVIIPTFVVSGHGSTTGEENFITTDNIYLLSGKEVHGSDYNDTSATLTRQLDYYSNLGVTTSSYSGTIKKLNGTATYWWLRSADDDYTHAFRGVGSTGKLYGNGAYISRGVAVAFRIG